MTEPDDPAVGRPASEADADVPGDAPTTPEAEHHEDGLDLARTIARGLARSRARQASSGGLPRRRRTPQVSGAGPDDRDPQTLDATVARFVADHGWDTELRVHGVFSRWAAIVGDEVAEHATPESFADGRLTCRTDSTAWATQLRMLAGQLVRRLNEELGDGTVTVIEVVGPNTPGWGRGRYRVKGRGPRDTYG